MSLGLGRAAAKVGRLGRVVGGVIKYGYRIAIAVDQLLNTVLHGSADETISSRLGRAKEKGKWWAKATCAVLAVADKDHCEDSIEYKPNGEPEPHHLPSVERSELDAVKALPADYRDEE